MTDPAVVLKQVFGFDAFRPHQEDVVGALASGRDALAVMPTSAGKSLCYQIPALMAETGTSVVVSPLISLMADQVAALQETGVAAAYLNSTLGTAEQDEVLARVGHGLRLLYVAPERLGDERLVRALRGGRVPLVAVDEAHCISQWGMDFRSDYLRIRGFADRLSTDGGAGRPPIAALTATATERVREDIVRTLGLKDPLRVVASFDRPNLAFSVERPRTGKERDARVVGFVKERQDRSGIVYAATRKQVDALWEALRAAGVRAARYHGGMSAEERTRAQEDFVHDRACCVVATNAFGMGIDKSDVSYVLHAAMPQSVEAYYQEAGRAGRDGTPAECVLLFREADLGTQRFLIEHGSEGCDDPAAEQARLASGYARLEAMRLYAVGEGCKRHALLGYFGEEAPERCDAHVEACGPCVAAAARAEQHVADEDRTEDALKALSCVARLQNQRRAQGRGRVTAVLLGSRSADVLERGLDRLPTYGLLSHLPKAEVERLLDLLCERGLLAQTAAALPVLYLTDAGLQAMRERAPFLAAPAPRRGTGAPSPHATARALGSGLGADDQALFEHLREVRRELAGDKPAYIVASNATLEDLARRRPTTMEELLDVRGIGQAKADAYGEELLEAVRSWAG